MNTLQTSVLTQPPDFLLSLPALPISPFIHAANPPMDTLLKAKLKQILPLRKGLQFVFRSLGGLRAESPKLMPVDDEKRDCSCQKRWNEESLSFHGKHIPWFWLFLLRAYGFIQYIPQIKGQKDHDRQIILRGSWAMLGLGKNRL